MSRHQLVFVCGLHRSGTSLLARAIADHPDASGFSETGFPEDEGQFLQSVYLPAFHLGGPGQFAFDHRSHVTERSALATAENRSRLLLEWGRYWDMEKPVLVEKSPPNLLKTRFLQTLFPEAIFVVIVRHPLAVSLSTRRRRSLCMTSLIRHWVICHELFERDASHLRRLIVVSYEELVANPALIADIQEALGLSPTFVDMQLKRGVNERYFAQWQLEPPLIARFEELTRRFGYSLARPNRADVDLAPGPKQMLFGWRSKPIRL